MVVNLHATLKFHTYIRSSGSALAKSEKTYEADFGLFLLLLAIDESGKLLLEEAYVLQYSGELNQWEAFNNSQNNFFSYILCSLKHT